MMIVRDFLRWLNSAPASERAEAAGILARTYLCSDLEADAIAVAEDLMLKLVDDPSPLVRRALADALAASPLAPPVVVMALTADQPQIAAPVYALSPLLVDADLLDAVATAIRAALLARDDLPAAIRQNLVTKVSETIADFVVGRSWLEADRARRITREACDKATVTIAAESPKAELRPLIRHLCGSGQLTAGLMLRALLSGNLALFEEGLAELSDMPVRRVCGLVRDRFGAGLPALLKKAQLPPSTHVAFKEAIAAMRDGLAGNAEDTARLQRRMIERVLTRYEDADVGEVASLLTLLRRFATEAARDEARLFCHELVGDELIGDELAAEPAAITYSAAA